MSTLTISFDDEGAWYRLGSEVTGSCNWRLDTDAKSIEVHLLWYTEGKGSQDIEVIASTEIERPEIAGMTNFSFAVPADGPYSFSGRFISLTWAVEAVVEPDGTAERVSILVGPRPTEVRLDPLDDD